MNFEVLFLYKSSNQAENGNIISGHGTGCSEWKINITKSSKGPILELKILVKQVNPHQKFTVHVPIRDGHWMLTIPDEREFVLTVDIENYQNIKKGNLFLLALGGSKLLCRIMIKNNIIGIISVVPSVVSANGIKNFVDMPFSKTTRTQMSDKLFVLKPELSIYSINHP